MTTTIDGANETLSRDQRAAAVSLAERTVEYGVHHGEPFPVSREIEALFPDGPRASFVTVHVAERLNGCVGRLKPKRTLPRDIVQNAFRAAFEDHRFPPVVMDDLERLDVHISVLNPLEPIPVEDEDELWEFVDPGRHGLLLKAGDKQGTFLPSVWEKCPDPETFLTHLKRKANLEPSAWPDDLHVFRYTVDEFDRETLADG